MNQEKIWNTIASDWSKFRVKTIKEVTEFLKNKTGNILDLGCGSGRNFVKIDGTIYGVDFSADMIKFAKESAEKKEIKVKLIKTNTINLPFNDDFFDSVIYIAALHCIPKSEDRKKSLKELLRVLKPNAEVLITVWSKKHPKLIKHPKDTTILWKTKTEEQCAPINSKNKSMRVVHRYYYLYDKKELEELLKGVGFKIVKSWEDKNINVIIRKPISS